MKDEWRLVENRSEAVSTMCAEEHQKNNRLLPWGGIVFMATVLKPYT